MSVLARRIHAQNRESLLKNEAAMGCQVIHRSLVSGQRLQRLATRLTID